VNPARRALARLVAGLLIVAAAWSANWSLTGLRTHLLFFPLWTGYALLVDGLTARLRGDSLQARSPLGWAKLFLLSAPVWWAFELVNLRTRNWEYVSRERFSDLEYFLLSTLSFSTVIPAVLSTAELMRGARWIERFAAGPRLVTSARGRRAIAAAGLVAALLLVAWPRIFYPFVWVAPVLVLEPLAYRRVRASGRQGASFLSQLERGDWRPWASLWAGGLVCGFFWELWNFRSSPKWIYHVPGVDAWRVFEMPLLGYLGYLPFAQTLYLVKELVLPRDPPLALMRARRLDDPGNA
jgi:hypothetical protein